MQQIDSHKHSNDYDKIDLRELFYVLLEGKWIVVFATAFVSIIAVIYSLSLPNIYESKAILVPVHSSNNTAEGLGSYRGIAGLAGISLPSISANAGNTGNAVQKISSLSFFEKNIMPNIYLPDLMAVKSWKAKTNTLIYNSNIFDVNSNTWVREYSYPQQQTPSAQESYRIFKQAHMSFNEDIESGIFTLSIKHQSPLVAKQWTELIINEVNSFYRLKDRFESERALSYLDKQFSMASLSEVKQVLAQLLQEETKKLTLIEAKQNYVFDYIDPPMVMEVKSGPRRDLICILAAIFGGMLSILFVLIRHYAFNDKAT